jgi:inosine-uridine nucleoside N-ribohydrolase
VLQHVGASAVPVFRGMQTAVTRDTFPNGDPMNGRAEQSKVHGAYLPLPEAAGSVQAEDAVSFLSRTYRDEASPPTLVAVGPLSNIAMVLRLDPSLAARVPALYCMGGGHGKGNASGSAEFNIWADPEGAELVFSAGIAEVTLVPLNATHEGVLHVDDVAAIKALGTPASEAVVGCCEVMLGWTGGPTFPCHDLLATMAVVAPSVLQELVYCHVGVETQGLYTVGQTVLDLRPRGNVARDNQKDENMHVALAADEALFREEFLGAMQADADGPRRGSGTQTPKL